MLIGLKQLGVLISCALVMGGMVLWSQTTASGGELDLDLERGQAALKSNNQALAVEEFRAALKVDPANVEAHANLGVIAFVHGDCPSAARELRGALHGNPNLTKAQGLIAVCEKRMGNPSAQQDLEKAFAVLDDPKLRTQVGVELADIYFQQGDLDHTLPVLHSLVEANPDNVDLLFFAQRVYSELADNTMNKLAVLAPDSARMQQLIAEQLINAGDLKGAIEHYRKAITIDPRLPGMHFELAESILESSNDANAQDAAEQELNAAIKVDGDNSHVECALGRIAMLRARDEEAYAHYKRANELNPNDVEAQLGLAAVLADENKLQDALQYLRSAVQADPMNANAHYRLARICHSLHLTEEAQKELKLYQDLRATKDRVIQLYRQMNRKAEGQGDAPVDEKN
jgi:tetratricopeptide (TPR) repeat protein